VRVVGPPDSIQGGEFLIRVARLGGGELLAGLLWEKFSGGDNLSNDCAKAGQGLAAYVRERPNMPAAFARSAAIAPPRC
jgi:hypothetical protein